MAEYKLPRVDGRGVIDMHIHVGPEFMTRRYTPMTLAEEARREGIGIVMKNHFQPTTTTAILSRRSGDTIPIIGSVALNYSCGGIDDHGVRGALAGWKSDVMQPDPDAQRFVVWMPTVCAESHLATVGYRDIPIEWGVAERHTRAYNPGEGLTIRDAMGNPSAGLMRALSLIAANDLVLASGHLSAAETMDLVSLARQAGVRRIVLTHPLWDATELAPEALAQLWRDHGAYTELCFVNLAICGIDKLTIGQYLEVIAAVGPEGIVLSTDLGQGMLMTMTEGLKIYFELLEREGVKHDDIVQMSVLNPHKLLFGN